MNYRLTVWLYSSTSEINYRRLFIIFAILAFLYVNYLLVRNGTLLNLLLKIYGCIQSRTGEHSCQFVTTVIYETVQKCIKHRVTGVVVNDFEYKKINSPFVAKLQVWYKGFSGVLCTKFQRHLLRRPRLIIVKQSLH